MYTVNYNNYALITSLYFLICFPQSNITHQDQIPFPNPKRTTDVIKCQMYTQSQTDNKINKIHNKLANNCGHQRWSDGIEAMQVFKYIHQPLPSSSPKEDRLHPSIYSQT